MIKQALKLRTRIELPQRKRAAVALILRPTTTCDDSDEYELLYIKRSTRDGDQWSGHVAFPGGKQESGESDLETASATLRASPQPALTFG